MQDDYKLRGPLTELSPFSNNGARANGLAMIGTATQRPLDSSDWRRQRRLDGMLRRENFTAIDELLYPDEPAAPRYHHVGGHPVFTQSDFRKSGHYDDFDRTLLQLTSDGNLCWGDVGEAAFLIRRNDLLARDFSQVIFYWDCT